MVFECDTAISITLPAARAAVAKRLSADYNMSQTEIAKRLGVAQAAVNKYLNNKYSEKIHSVEMEIVSEGLDKKAAKQLSKKSSSRNHVVDDLASKKEIIGKAMSLI